MKSWLHQEHDAASLQVKGGRVGGGDLATTLAQQPRRNDTHLARKHTQLMYGRETCLHKSAFMEIHIEVHPSAPVSIHDSLSAVKHCWMECLDHVVHVIKPNEHRTRGGLVIEFYASFDHINDDSISTDHHVILIDDEGSSVHDPDSEFHESLWMSEGFQPCDIVLLFVASMGCCFWVLVNDLAIY